jgi:dTDP-4-dehydrorhamnose 3,5-epimerase
MTRANAQAPGRPPVEDLDAAVADGTVAIVPPGSRDRGAPGPAGEPLAPAIAGVIVSRLEPISDHRGSLTELVNFDHEFWFEPIVHAYRITIRPGRIKGWGMHKLQADRYCVTSPQVRVVLFDGRKGSPSFGALQQIHFGPTDPSLVRIPPGVWHADQNYGDEDAEILNFPTRRYEHANPDKYRVDPHSGEIPFDWELPDA